MAAHAISGTGTEPLVSVIVPSYNVAPYIDEALASLRSQTLEALEIICVNDASTDDTLMRLEAHAAADPRIVINVHPNNRGLSAARNSGIELATGRYVYFFDGDDILKPEALQTLVELAEHSQLATVFFNAEPFFEASVAEEHRAAYRRLYDRRGNYGTRISGAQLFSEMQKNGEWRSSVCLYLTRRELILNSDLKFAEGQLHEDHWFTLAIAIASGQVGYTNRSFFRRRVREGSITMSRPTVKNVLGLLRATSDTLGVTGRFTAPEGYSGQLQAAIVQQAIALFNEAQTAVSNLTPDEAAKLEASISTDVISDFLRHTVITTATREALIENIERSLDLAHAECEGLRAQLSQQNRPFWARVLRRIVG